MTPVYLRIDNKEAILQIDNEAVSTNGEHVNIRLEFLRDYAAKGNMKTEFAETKAMIANLLTEPLPAPPRYQ